MHPEPPQLDRRRVDTPLLHMAVHLTSHRGTGRGPRTYIRLQVLYIFNPLFDFNVVCLQKDNEGALCDAYIVIGILCQCAPQQL